MIVAVGSKNNTKIEAVRLVLKEYNQRGVLEDADVVSVAVQTPTAQPLTLEATVEGAKMRAEFAKNFYQYCTWGIGLEGGLILLPGSRTGYEERTYCALYDGRNFFFGSSPGFEHPASVIQCVLQQKVDISEAYKLCGLTDAAKIGEKEGCIGLLTHGIMDRTEYNKLAVLMALTQIVT